MKWPDIRTRYPGSWLLIEALDAHTTQEKQRVIDNLVAIEQDDFIIEAGAMDYDFEIDGEGNGI
jgi:hypothetical protein